MSFPEILSFDEQNILIFMKSSLSILSFVYSAFDVISKKSLPNPMLWRFSLMFSSKSFLVLVITFMSLTHFELISVCGVK